MDRLEQAMMAVAAVPGVFGAVLCDYEGEAVVCRFGPQPMSGEILAQAASQVPRAVRKEASSAEYLLRLAGAEPCAMLALFQKGSVQVGAGGLETIELGFRRVRVVLVRLPDDYYLAVFAESRSGAVLGLVRQAIDRVRPVLVEEVG